MGNKVFLGEVAPQLREGGLPWEGAPEHLRGYFGPF